jgi:hypothetical protein
MKFMNLKKDLGDKGRIKKRIKIAVIILILTLLVFAGYFLFFYASPCNDISCFSNALGSCKSVSWIKEDAQASWLYIIKGSEGRDSCNINVKLLSLKQGAIDIEKLQGKEMDCIAAKGDARFPEKNLATCHGYLKEQLQDLIIQRMHNYLIENVGEIKQEFGEL